MMEERKRGEKEGKVQQYNLIYSNYPSDYLRYYCNIINYSQPIKTIPGHIVKCSTFLAWTNILLENVKLCIICFP